MKNYSIWQDNIKHDIYPELLNSISVDVLIIGGGITGISSLYHLANSKLKTILVEQQSIGMSTTSRSTGKLSYLQNDLLDKIRMSSGDEIAYQYINSQIDAINMIKRTIQKENIKCDFIKVNSKLYTNNKKEIKEMQDLSHFLEKKVQVIQASSSLVDSKYMFEVENTYLIHPVKFLNSLASKLDNIYEKTSIKKITRKDNYYYCYTDKVEIKAKYVIIATHYPYFNLPYFFPIKGTIEKSYLEAAKYCSDAISLISYSSPFISIRNYQDYLIYLSNSHSINKDVDDKKHFIELVKKCSDLGLKGAYFWSNSDILTNDGLPYIGKISDNLFIGTGYNTWGLTNGFLAGKIISDIILNEKNQYIELFDPKRDNLEQIIGGVNAAFKNISGYLSGLIYGKSKKYCTHMGCKLVYNKVEKTYDCPCHGSRFNINGEAIVAPANHDLKNK